MKQKVNEKKILTLVEAEEVPMVETTAELPEIFSDGAGAVEIHGDNVHVIYCTLRKVSGVETRVPVLRMIRPLRTCGHGDMMRLLDKARGGAGRHH